MNDLLNLENLTDIEREMMNLLIRSSKKNKYYESFNIDKYKDDIE